MSEFVCPNGHAVAPVRVHNCQTCRAGVVYEPAARGMAFFVALDRAHTALDDVHGHTPETLADRARFGRPR